MQQHLFKMTSSHFGLWKRYLKRSKVSSSIDCCDDAGFWRYYYILSSFGEQKGLKHIFLFFLINAIVSTLIRPFTGKWFDKHGPWSIIIVSAIFGFLSLIVLSYTTNNFTLIIAAILFGGGYGTVMPCLQTWAVQK